MGSDSPLRVDTVHWPSYPDALKRLTIATQLPDRFCHKQQHVDESQLKGDL
jgi:hypothetical protein